MRGKKDLVGESGGENLFRLVREVVSNRLQSFESCHISNNQHSLHIATLRLLFFKIAVWLFDEGSRVEWRLGDT